MKSCENHVSCGSDYYIYSPSMTALEMFLYPVQCGYFQYEPGYFLRRDSFDSFLIMYLQKGTLTLEIEGRTLRAAKGCFMLIDCYQLHSYYTDTGAECLWCHFDGITACSYYKNIISHSGNVFTMTDPYPAIRKLKGILEIFSEGKTVREPLISKYLTDILTAFLLSFQSVEGPRSYANMAEEIITYINEHFAESITVEELAGRAGLSQFHFIRTFKKETGFTPHEYLINTRIATARYLLKNTDRSVKDICFYTGFSSESVFCSAFKKHQGMTPAGYRNMDGL